MSTRLQLLQGIARANPFAPERSALVRQLLGSSWRDDLHEPALVRKLASADDQNFAALLGVLESTMAEHRARGVDREEWSLLVLQLCFGRLRPDFSALVQRTRAGELNASDCYARFLALWQQWVPTPEAVDSTLTPEHAFAILFQLRRAFDAVFDSIVGGAPSAAKVRADVWASLFTKDPVRYFQVLYGRLGGFATLILGPSGTGKELLATALAHGRYVPFDPRTGRFAANPYSRHQAINVSGFAATLVESELFGHVRGAFTGAVSARIGWLEQAGAHGSVLLDEIGELDPALQVKLLRVLQDRTFARVGESTPRRFEGKVIAATNRDLWHEREAGRFRSDLYYRLSADVIHTAPLRRQLEEDPTELEDLVRFVSARLLGAGAHAEALTREACAFIRRELGETYPWPGNVRELEQCVRNVLLRGEYRPEREQTNQLSDRLERTRLALEACNGELATLTGAACLASHQREGSWVQAATKLGLDRRTVKRQAVAFARAHRLPIPR